MSQRSAEGLYQAIYAASRQGHVTPETLATARQAYAQWVQAQTRYLLAAESGQYDLDAAHDIQAQINILAGLAARYEVQPWNSH